ncbi:MAG: 1,4-alpha-glucan branching enzyme, partial [Candidatus Binatia bacterium]
MEPLRENHKALPTSAGSRGAASPLGEASLLSEQDLYLFNEGSHFRLYEKLGAHLLSKDGSEGVYFAVWAPDAERVSVIGSFNDWKKNAHRLHPRGTSGIWEGYVPQARRGNLYKYHIVSRVNGYQVEKADPFSLFNEIPPKRASIVWDLDYMWGDREWMKGRHSHNRLDSPIAI